MSNVDIGKYTWRDILRNEWIYILASVLYAMFPYIWLKIKLPFCGWDCTWYALTLAQESYATFHASTEPLYYWIFGWMTSFTDPFSIIYFSQLILPFILFLGTYFLARRMGLDPISTSFAIVVLAYSTGTRRLWWDTLRNLTAFALLPWFIYFFLGSKKEHLFSYLVMLLMMVAHRVSLLVMPIVLAFYYTNPRNKKAFLYTGITMVVSSILFMIFLQPRWDYITIPVNLLKLFMTNPVQELIVNASMIWWSIGPMIILLLLGIGFVGLKLFRDPRYKFLKILFLMVFIGTLLVNNLSAGRLGLMLGLPTALVVAWYFQEVRYNPSKYKPLGISVFIAIFLIVGIFSLDEVQAIRSHSHPEEIKMIQNIKLPDNSILIGPARLYPTFYRNNLEMKVSEYFNANLWNSSEPTIKIYQGQNLFNKTVYILDGDHWLWTKEKPLTLYKVYEDGSREFISEVVYD